MRFAAVLAACAALSACATSPGPQTAADPAQSWWAHVAELADDRYEGRFTGTPGYQRAAEYVAGRFRDYGLRPAGTDRYLQPVRFVEQRLAPERSTVGLTTAAGVQPLAVGEDLILGARSPVLKTVDAPLVFIGYGLHLPEAGYDDFAGQDLRGKVVVYLNGGPASLSAALKSHARGATFTQALERAGALGAISLANPRSMDVPWARQIALSATPSMYLADPALRDAKGPLFNASFNPARAQALFAASGREFSELLALADAGQPLPRFPLNVGVRAQVEASVRELESSNVVALLPGSDRRLREQYVVLTAHLDGLGVGQPIDGDAIYNGAMDNAAGIASLLETARAFKETGRRPRRSVLFVAVTGEERGLLGSRAFAERPTVARAALAANVNMDMFLPITPLKALTVLGMDESTLGDQVREAASAQGLGLVPDPTPDRNSFIRSDQYSFIRTGVPAVALKFAAPPGSPEAAAQSAWLRSRYHAPSDDLSQPVDVAGAARFNGFLVDLIARVADTPERPAWAPQSFFRRFAAPQAAAGATAAR